jgi:hypothetical protein
MTPRRVRPRRDTDLVEVVNRQIWNAAAQLVQHERLAGSTRSEEQKEHDSRPAG